MFYRVRFGLAKAIGASPLCGLTLAGRRALRGPWLTVVNYHRVQEAESAGPFDLGVVDATPSAFAEQVRFLDQHFELVTLEDVRRFVAGHSLPPNPALITFDDGYRECHDVALPILQDHGVRAAFFIATDFIERRRVFWWDRISFVLKKSKCGAFLLSYPYTIDVDLRDSLERSERRLHAVVKDTSNLDLERFLQHLGASAEVAWDGSIEARLAEQLLMTWEQVRKLRRAGMDVGSHTRSHRVLQTLPSEALQGELVGSRLDLERELGEPVRALAYPVGRPIAHLPGLREAVATAGYDIAFTYGTGPQPLRRVDPLGLRRMSVEREWTAAAFRGVMALPFLL
jgi:peptidoglycan/xylan/chitin deacetylase (PgdA/CDA1 family)